MSEKVKKKFEEYIKILKNERDYVISSDDKDREFSDGKKIGSFFIEHALDIVNLFFVDEKYKSKVEYFGARGKIIEYIATHSAKKIEDAYNVVLDYINNYDNKKDIMRNVSISMANDGGFKRKVADKLYIDYYNYDENDVFDIEDYINNSALLYAASAEKLLKAAAIYNEFIGSSDYTYAPKNMEELNKYRGESDKKNIIGSTSWRKEINKKTDLGIRSEESLLKLIQNNGNLSPTDDRANLTPENLEKTSGHNLYSLYTLLNPVTKTLINSEFYIYDVENPDNKRKDAAMLAILKEDLTYDRAGTKETKENLKNNANQFVHARYADIDLTSVKPDELEFLKRLSTAIDNYISYIFPRRKIYDNTDYNDNLEALDDTGLNSFDKVTRHNLVTYFSKSEIDKLESVVFKENKNKLNYEQQDMFVRLTIFFKHYIVTRLNSNIPFEDAVYDKLYKYYESIKEFNLFDGVSDNIFLNSFFTKENVDRLNEEIKNNSSKTGSREIEEKNIESIDKEVEESEEEKDKVYKQVINELLERYSGVKKDLRSELHNIDENDEQKNVRVITSRDKEYSKFKNTLNGPDAVIVDNNKVVPVEVKGDKVYFLDNDMVIKTDDLDFEWPQLSDYYPDPEIENAKNVVSNLIEHHKRIYGPGHMPRSYKDLIRQSNYYNLTKKELDAVKLLDKNSEETLKTINRKDILNKFNNNTENEKPAETVKDNLTQMEEMQKRIEELQKKIASQKEEIDYLNNLSNSKSDEIPRTEEKVISLDNNDLPSLNDIASSYIDASDDETFITPEDIPNTPEPIVEIEDVNGSSVNFPEPVMANTVAEDTPNNASDQDEDDLGLKR